MNKNIKRISKFLCPSCALSFPVATIEPPYKYGYVCNQFQLQIHRHKSKCKFFINPKLILKNRDWNRAAKKSLKGMWPKGNVIKKLIGE